MTDASGRVLVIGAHPDDPDFLAGGTVARLIKEGREVAYVIATNGNKGSSDRTITMELLVALREAEQRRAAGVLGVGRVEFLGYEDGELEDTRTLRRDVTREIRRWRPDLVITLNPARTYTNSPGWHRDHRTIARVVMDCVYPLARDYHASQMSDVTAFEARMRNRAATIGMSHGYAYAEGFDHVAVPG
jgi:LmbE family N-acetylglucosaminyl deacetylase